MWSLIIGRDVENGLEIDFRHFLDFFRLFSILNGNRCQFQFERVDRVTFDFMCFGCKYGLKMVENVTFWLELTSRFL